jgi:hypothetical protein
MNVTATNNPVDDELGCNRRLELQRHEFGPQLKARVSRAWI